MVFSSTLFLFYFLPFFLLVYHVVPKSLKNWVIFFFSILFYTWGAPVFVFILLGTSFLDFLLVRTIHQSQDAKRRKILLIISLSINLGLLAYFKYSNFFVGNANALLESFGLKEVTWTKVIMPIGISFFTFESITYTVDVYRGKHAPLKNLKDYLLYLLAFPKLIAGPIVRFQEIADEVIERKENIDEKLIGFYRFSIGLAKKVLIANVMAEQAKVIFDTDFHLLSASTAWIGILAYTMQIYFDFSGYSDMAIGLGKIMVFHFPENFNSPYSSKSITEFWRRWHISLSTWFRDYLYIPLGGSKGGLWMQIRNTIIIFVVSGFWHGANWTFIIWGALNALYIMPLVIFGLNRKNTDIVAENSILPSVKEMLQMLVTFAATTLAWIFFRAESVGDAWAFIISIFSPSSFGMPQVDLKPFIFIFILLVVEWFNRKKQYGLNLDWCKSTAVRWAIYIAVILLIVIFGASSDSFIYFQF